MPPKNKTIRRYWMKSWVLCIVASLLPITLGVGYLYAYAKGNFGPGVDPTEALIWGLVTLFVGVTLALFARAATVFEITEEDFVVRRRWPYWTSFKGRFRWDEVEELGIQTSWGMNTRTSRRFTLYVKNSQGVHVIDSGAPHTSLYQAFMATARSRGVKVIEAR